jgi:hypothetical protein
VIDDPGPLRRGGCLSWVGGIGGHSLRSLGCMPAAAHGSHAPSPAQKLGNDGSADPASCAKDDISGVESHGARPYPWNRPGLRWPCGLAPQLELLRPRPGLDLGLEHHLLLFPNDPIRYRCRFGAIAVWLVAGARYVSRYHRTRIRETSRQPD